MLEQIRCLPFRPPNFLLKNGLCCQSHRCQVNARVGYLVGIMVFDRNSGIVFHFFLIIWSSDTYFHAFKGSVRPSVRPSEGLSACALYLWSHLLLHLMTCGWLVQNDSIAESSYRKILKYINAELCNRLLSLHVCAFETSVFKSFTV